MVIKYKVSLGFDFLINDKIGSIKAIRALTGWGLKSSKEATDSMFCGEGDLKVVVTAEMLGCFTAYMHENNTQAVDITSILPYSEDQYIDCT
jgi:hypothetical protein